MTYFYELNHTPFLALKGEEDLRKGSNMNGQVRKILQKSSSKLAVIIAPQPAIVIRLNFILLSQDLKRSVFSYTNPCKIWTAEDEILLEDLLPFSTF